MITRFQVTGFKNLVGVDLRFGPFTCIAGINGVGKSNLFDAIRFLGALASHNLMQAAGSVRDNRRAADVRSIFHRVGNGCDECIRFDVEMIVPERAVDDLGQTAKASITFLRYELELGLKKDPESGGLQLEIRHEALWPLKQSEATANLCFEHSPKWRRSVVLGVRRGGPFVSTDQDEDGRRVIQRHQDGGGGKPIPAPASSLLRTVASVASAEARTLLCARREMESWLQLQLEPTALRQPSAFNTPPHLQPNGEGLAATLFRVARNSKEPEAVYARVANRLTELINDVRTIGVARDEKLELVTLMLTDRDGTEHAARSLSDGTLRFLALTVLEMDPETHGVLCLEEPENGIHPERIAAMLDLLQDIAIDPDQSLGPDNPLRQVIINTHSPLVVGECPDDSLVMAHSVDDVQAGRAFRKIVFNGIEGTWRGKMPGRRVAKGQLLAYLSPTSLQPAVARLAQNETVPRVRRVRERPDLLPAPLPGFETMMVAET
jgi:predicted ATPase